MAWVGGNKRGRKPSARGYLDRLRKNHTRFQSMITGSGDANIYRKLGGEIASMNPEAQTENALLARIVACSDDAIISKTLDGVITSWNPGAERMFGFQAADAIGRHISLIIPPDRLGEEAAILERLRQGEPIEDFETTRVAKSGRAVAVSLSVSPLRDSAGNLTGGSKILRDITRRKQLQAEINEQLMQRSADSDRANHAKSEFLSTVSHEIRTPLNAILGMADLLWEMELDATARKYVEVFRRAGANLLTLVNDILDLSKIESGHFELEQVPFDLEELLERTVEIMLPKAQAKRLELKTRIAPCTPDILTGDPTRLQQVLLHLIGNAVKFTSGGQVTLTVEVSAADPRRLHYEVADTGPGIPADKIACIFDDFTQAESSTTRPFGGTGLGLGISRRLVHRMGGQLSVRSEPGRGSTFYFDAVFAEARPDARRSRRKVANLAGLRVLIIDSNPTNRLIFTNMCSGWGMAASECATATAAIAVLRMAAKDHQAFDLVVVDPLLPDMDGFDLMAKIRGASADVRILVAVSENAPGDQTKIQEFGVSGFAVKPVRGSDLLRLVCKALGTSSEQGDEDNNALSTGCGKTKTRGAGRILVVEDSEDNRFLLQVYLKNAPYAVTFAENGEAALGLMHSQSFDLILMDIQMPVMDGLTATKLIRELERERGSSPIPILALSANAGKDDMDASRSAGCDSHLPKPISRAVLVSALDRYLSGEEPDRAPAPPLIDVPAGLEELAKVYFQRRKDEVPHLLELLATQQFDQLRAVAHNLKGTGTSYGFADVTRLGALIESSAQEKDSEVLGEQLRALSNYLEKAETAVQLLIAT